MYLVAITHGDSAFDFESHPEEIAGSCRGCEVKAEGIPCYSLPNCNRRIWKLAAPTLTKGPYHDVWVTQRRTAQAASRPKFPIAAWEDPVAQVTNLQYMLRDMRNLGGLNLLPEAIREALKRFGLPTDWHKLALEFPAVSGSEVIYIGSERAMQQYIDGQPLKQITTKMGRYLARHWPHVEPHNIRDIVMLYGEGVVEMQYTMSEMIYAVQTGPCSCMQWPEGEEFGYRNEDADGDEYDTDIHPYEVYDPELGWAMAVFKKQGSILGRTLVHRPTKTFARSYGKVSDGYSGSCAKSEAWLVAQGYKLVDAWPEGVRLRTIRSDHGYVVPYLDPGQNRRAENGNRCKLVEEDGKTYFERDNGGEYVFDNTDGTVTIDKIQRETCSCCGANTDTYRLCRVYDPTQETQNLVCPSCVDAGGYRYAEIDAYNTEYIAGQYAMDDPATWRVFLKSAVDSGDLVKSIAGEWEWKASCVATKTGEWVRSSQVSSYESHKPYRYMDGYAVPRDEVVDCAMTRETIYKTEGVQLTPVAWVKASNFEAFVSVQTKAVISRYLPEIQPRCMEVWEAANESVDTPAASAVDNAQKLQILAASFGASATMTGSAFRRAVENLFSASGAVRRSLRPAVAPFEVRTHQVPAPGALALEDDVLSSQTNSSN